jgi:hypothetical protein
VPVWSVSRLARKLSDLIGLLCELCKMRSRDIDPTCTSAPRYIDANGRQADDGEGDLVEGFGSSCGKVGLGTEPENA